jgi:hypothetical protein
VAGVEDEAAIFPLSKAAKPPATRFVGVAGVQSNTISANDVSLYDELNAVVQNEPVDRIDPDTVGRYGSIGIRKARFPFGASEPVRAPCGLRSRARGCAARRLGSHRRTRVRSLAFGGNPLQCRIRHGRALLDGRCRCCSVQPYAGHGGSRHGV